MKKSKLLKIILMFIILVLLFDNFSTLKNYNFNTVSYNYGTNCDITNGALYKFHNKSYIIIFSNNDTLRYSKKNAEIVLKQRGEIDYGIFSFIPFYKSIQPKMTFDCFKANTSKYIGKIEIEKKICMKGFLNRNNMKTFILNDYLDETKKILEYKSIAYNNSINSSSFQNLENTSQFKNNNYNGKLMASLWAPKEGINRDIPIREKEEVYTDTIFFENKTQILNTPLYEIYKVDKPQKKIIYLSYNSKSQLIFSKTFKLKKVVEEENKFISFIAFDKMLAE